MSTRSKRDADRTPQVQVATQLQAPGKRSSVTPGRITPVGPGKRSRTQSLRRATPRLPR